MTISNTSTPQTMVMLMGLLLPDLYDQCQLLIPVTFEDRKLLDVTPYLESLPLCTKGMAYQGTRELQPYNDQLHIKNGCVMWSMCVIVTQTLHSQVLKSLHDNHPGITRMKATAAQNYFWWTGLDKAIEGFSG